MFITIQPIQRFYICDSRCSYEIWVESYPYKVVICTVVFFDRVSVAIAVPDWQIQSVRKIMRVHG